MAESNGEILDRLFAVILSRREGDPAASYVARQLQAGTSKLAQKVGEEAVETALAAVSGDKRELVSESADLYAELTRREGISGLDAKKVRKGN